MHNQSAYQIRINITQTFLKAGLSKSSAEKASGATLTEPFALVFEFQPKSHAVVDSSVNSIQARP